MLRREDDAGVRAFLGRLERDGAKALGPPVFSGYGGGGFGVSGGQGPAFFAPWQVGSKHDYAAEAGDTWRNSAVAACLGWIGDNFPEPAMRVMRRDEAGDEKPVPDHPLVNLLRNPNPNYGWHALAKAFVLGYRTDGNAHWLVAGDASGVPRQLWAIPHFRIWPRWDSTGKEYIGWWDYQVDGRIIRLGTDQVIHFRDGIDPYNDRLGCAALKHTLREVCSDNQGASFTASIMRNMGIVGYILQPKSEGDDFGDKEERDEIADAFQERFSGEGRGRPLVSSVGMQVDQVGMTPEQLTLDKIMQIPESRICAALRLPAQVVGLAVGKEMKTYANYSEARKSAYEDGIIPAQKEMAWVINQRLLPLLGDPKTERFEFDYSGVQCLAESEDAKAKRWGDAYQLSRLVTLNEGRKALALPPVPGGDKFADGSTPEEGPRTPPPPPAPSGGEPPDGEEPDDEAEATKALLGRAAALLDGVERRARAIEVGGGT